MKTDCIGAQLYTVRRHCREVGELAASLRHIRAIGYEAVEIAGIRNVEIGDAAVAVRDAGLKACSVHVGNLLDEPGCAVEQANILECNLVVCSYPRWFDPSRHEDVALLIDKLETAGRRLAEEEKTLCFHHHSLELSRYGSTTVLRHILDAIAPEVISLELDTYWIQHGGGNPVDWCRALHGRLPIIHLKDYGIVGNQPTMMEVGCGNLDFGGIIGAAAHSGCRWWIVEQDICPRDPFESLKISYDNLIGWANQEETSR